MASMIPKLLRFHHHRNAMSLLYGMSTRNRHKLHDGKTITDSESGSQSNPIVSIGLLQVKKYETNSTLLLPEEDAKDFFRLNDLFSIEDLMKSRVHLGHKESMLNPHMRPYIFGKRLGVLIFDLEQTARLLNLALHVIAEIAYREGIVLFVHQSRQNGHLVEAAAKDCGEYAHCRRWKDGIFTDSYNVFGAVTRLPDLVVLLSTVQKVNELHRAVKLSAKLLIPTIGICDTNSDPTLVTYPVPGNDDTPQSIEFYCRLFKTAVLNGKSKREEIIAKYGQEFYDKTLETS